ncbi:MAG: elongation factor P [Candidatus Terrybacteria bacterium CG10_big_fil_rev_8_21_14_0_10_41_10]|uniref:Elongation factor P n=1 Tax=Candidatus Terrybacteria bacterium CG10_big_fil_rev_8_21_14_0_10_41_10 TaxID=1975026 RepID=A0A2M8LAM3_9BACT|nr:MAG: elongation factor P [Candidatus Terrybacteria bacterium CG10_big_fil_rev_8_21_14_0_10_41_10]
MISYNELKSGKVIVFEDQPYTVVEAAFLRMQQRKPVMQAKLKNLITGKTVEKNFQPSDKFEEAEINTRPIKYLYSHKGEHWFCEEKDPSKRFQMENSLIGDKIGFIKPNTIIEAVTFGEQTIGVKLPIKMELEVKEAPPSTKGNTAQGGSKQVTLETGAVINTPMFVEAGDRVIINTDTGEYVERAK